jgi:hypothetical protein
MKEGSISFFWIIYLDYKLERAGLLDSSYYHVLWFLLYTTVTFNVTLLWSSGESP